jgi:hypothetical protein
MRKRTSETTANGNARARAPHEANAAGAADDQAQRPAHVPAEPHVIHPNAVYFGELFQRLFRMTKSTLRREVREGRLRVSKRGGRYLLLGSWILAWIEAGEVQRRRGQAPPGEVGNGDS